MSTVFVGLLVCLFISRVIPFRTSSRRSLSRLNAYLEVKIWSLPKHGNLTKGNKILWKKGEILLGAISPIFNNSFIISLTSGVKLHVYLLNVVVRFIFPSILQI